jgi:hypothetical protein
MLRIQDTQAYRELLESTRAVRQVLLGSTMGRVGMLAMAGVLVASSMSAKPTAGLSAKSASPEPPAASSAEPVATVGFSARFENNLPDEPPARVAALPPSEPTPSTAMLAEPRADEAAPPAAMPAAEPAVSPVLVTVPIPVALPAPVREASLLAEPSPDEYPKSVSVYLPIPRPPPSPAQRLELQGKDYDRAEKCLAQAIYFEARNEPARGQQAVAQVVLNRVFSPHYPKDVCSVVYQNAHRHLACQFTFACDGKADRVRERGAWAQANRIAQQSLNAWFWLPEVNKATHYHATYVRPYWIRDMKVMARYGLHVFYRPRNWGDGANEAQWGTPQNSVKSAASAKPVASAKPAVSRSVHRTHRIGSRRAYARYHRA